MVDGLRGYIQVATGLTEVTAAKAREIVSGLLAQGVSLSSRAPDVLGQVQSMADDLMSTGKDNREMLIGLIRSEVDRTVARMGFVREDELAALRRQVESLQDEVRAGQVHRKTAETTGSQADDSSSAGDRGKDDAPKPAVRKKKVVVQKEADS